MPKIYPAGFKKKRKIKMRQMESNGLNRSEIGRRLGVSKELVRQILGNCKQVRKLCLWCDQWFVAADKTPGCSSLCNYMWREHGVSQAEHDKTQSDIPLNRITSKIAPPNNRGCWEWRGYCNLVTGYGITTWQGIHWSLHRLIYSLAIGEIPQNLFVLHHCDNRKCTNPRHLYLGTQMDNMRDREVRSRDNRSRRFSPGEIADIKKAYRSNKDLPELSCVYGVDAGTILSLVKGRTYTKRYPGRVLTDKVVKRARGLYLGGNYTHESLAVRYGVGLCTMGDALRGTNAYQNIS